MPEKTKNKINTTHIQQPKAQHFEFDKKQIKNKIIF